jgi:hypothetical protein
MADSTEAQGLVTEDQGGETAPATTENAPKTEKQQADPKSQPSQAKDEKKGPSPWRKDLEGFGLAPEHLDVLDTYLGEQWQPRMTQLEQEAAQYSKLFGGDLERAQIMANIAMGLEQDPAGTYRQIGELLELVDDSGDGEPDDGAPGDIEDDEPAQPQDDPRLAALEEILAERKQAEADHLYESVMEKTREAYPGMDEDLFNHLILANGGDVEAATAAYDRYHDKVKNVEPEPDVPPPTAGEPVAPTPPEAKQYGSVKDAVNDWVSQLGTSRSTMA